MFFLLDLINSKKRILTCTFQKAKTLRIFHSYVPAIMSSSLIPLCSLSTLVVQTLAVMFRETGAEAAKLDVLTAEK